MGEEHRPLPAGANVPLEIYVQPSFGENISAFAKEVGQGWKEIGGDLKAMVVGETNPTPPVAATATTTAPAAAETSLTSEETDSAIPATTSATTSSTAATATVTATTTTPATATAGATTA